MIMYPFFRGIVKVVGASSFGQPAIGTGVVVEGEGSNGKSTKTRILHSVGSAVVGKMKKQSSSRSGSGMSLEGEEGELGQKKKKNLDILKRVKVPKRSP